MKAYDLSGQRFGRLVAQYKCNYKKSRWYPWHCICDCGNEVDVPTRSLVSGNTKSCGCLQREIASKIGKKTIIDANQKRLEQTDKTNWRFGHLVALSLEYSDDWDKPKWKCQCDCGTICYVISSSLQSGNTTSCGCIRSKGEEKIANLLSQNNILFEKEKTFDSCRSDRLGRYRFDFWVDSRYVIEYDGIQHFQEISFFTQTVEERKHDDLAKNQWCKDNGIPIIRIPYQHLNDLVIEDLIPETSNFIIK